MDDFESLIEEVEALESFMDELGGELELEAAIESYSAMEAEGEESANAPASKASGLGAKLRGAFNKLAGAFKRGDKKAAERANAEITMLAGELEDAASGADEEGKKKLGVAAKIGIAAGAAVLLTAGFTASGQLLKKRVNVKLGEGKDVSSLTTLIVGASNKVMNAIEAIPNKIASSKKNAIYNDPKYKDTSGDVARYTSKGQKKLDRLNKVTDRTEARKAENSIYADVRAQNRENRRASKATNESMLDIDEKIMMFIDNE